MRRAETLASRTPVSRTSCPKPRAVLLIEVDDFARSLEADFLNLTRAIWCHAVYDFIRRVRCSMVHNFSLDGRYNLFPCMKETVASGLWVCH